MEIFRSGTRKPVEGGAEQFTGRVAIEPVIQTQLPARVQGARVSFEPGARTAWHSHPLGQTLIVLEGRGLVQAWGQDVREIGAGDVVWTGPGEKHWHGASEESRMTHLAIQEALEGKVVDWMEKVSDEQYRSTRWASSRPEG